MMIFGIMERRERALVVLAMYWCFYMLIQHVLSMQALILGFELQNSALVVTLCGLWNRKERGVWSIDRQEGFCDRHLMGSYTELMFRERTRVSHATFQYLCEELGPFLRKQDTNYRNSITVERRVAMSLVRLGSGNGLQIVGDLFGVAKSTVSKIVRDFCRMVRLHLQKKFVTFPSEYKFRELAKDFEALHGIPYVVGAIDGSHIPIIAPVNGGEDYYCRKSFHSALLQGIVDTNCIFWDYEFGWAGSMHDCTVFKLTKVGRKCIEGKLLPYKLIGDAAYPVRPWIYCPFKGGVDVSLPAYKAHWNFIQSSTRMCVERAFGILKCRWRIIMKRMECPLKYVPDVVASCIILHNICIISADVFDREWIKVAEEDLERREIEGQIAAGQELRGERTAIAEVRRRIGIGRKEPITIAEEDYGEAENLFLIKEDEEESILLQEATDSDVSIAKALWKYHLQKNSTIVFDDTDSDMSM
jgi:hypothetical protein